MLPPAKAQASLRTPNRQAHSHACLCKQALRWWALHPNRSKCDDAKVMRSMLRLAALVAFIAIVILLAVYGGVIGGLIGLQSPDPHGPFSPDSPDLNGGLRGAYAGLIAGALVRRAARRARGPHGRTLGANDLQVAHPLHTAGARQAAAIRSPNRRRRAPTDHRSPTGGLNPPTWRPRARPDGAARRDPVASCSTRSDPQSAGRRAPRRPPPAVPRPAPTLGPAGI